jgi:hypothetical protein
MADLELKAQKVIGVDSTFAHKVYKKDDGSQTVFEISSDEILAWQLTYHTLTAANYAILYALWQSKKLLLPFTWLNPFDEEWNVQFLKTPKFQIFGGNKRSCSFTLKMISATGADITDPVCSITTPTSNPTYDNGSTSTITLGGVASDNVGVTSVTWENDRGGSGSASGTTSWSITGIALSSGENVIEVTAFDAQGNSHMDSITVTYTPAASGNINDEAGALITDEAGTGIGDEGS